MDRAILLSDRRFHNRNIELIKNILRNNCFPEHIIKKHVNDRIKVLSFRHSNAVENSNCNNIQEEKKKNFIVIPYVNGVAQSVSRVLKNCKFDVLHTVPKKLDCIIKRGKEKLKFDVQTELVYKIDCADRDISYIGQTKRHLSTRIREHNRDIRKHVSNPSVISKHRITRGHDFNWSQSKILHREKHTRKREIAEMFFIKKHTNTINSQRDTENLSAIYDKLIKAT